MSERVVTKNKQARRDYEIFDTMEAGMVLQGSEVKSLRQGQADLKGSFARVEGEEVWLYDCHIAPYEQAGYAGHDPKRRRKLLLRREEIRRLIGKVAQKGLTLIPLRIYFRRGYAKVELAIARARTKGDKRHKIEEQTARREMQQAVRRHKG
ncbi:MAG: SsrA-binding protein SmpB [bacterium]